jgi:hypothetical protein
MDAEGVEGGLGVRVRCSRFERALGGVGFLTRLSVNNVRRHPWGGDLLDLGGATLWRARLRRGTWRLGNLEFGFGVHALSVPLGEGA